MQHALHRSRIAAAQPADDRPHDNRMPVKPRQVSQLINPAAIEAWAYCSRSPAERLQTCAGNFRGLSVGEGDSLYSRQITQLLRLPSHAVSNRIEAERLLCPRQSFCSLRLDLQLRDAGTLPIPQFGFEAKLCIGVCQQSVADKIPLAIQEIRSIWRRWVNYDRLLTSLRNT